MFRKNCQSPAKRYEKKHEVENENTSKSIQTFEKLLTKKVNKTVGHFFKEAPAKNLFPKTFGQPHALTLRTFSEHYISYKMGRPDISGTDCWDTSSGQRYVQKRFFREKTDLSYSFAPKRYLEKTLRWSASYRRDNTKIDLKMSNTFSSVQIGEKTQCSWDNRLILQKKALGCTENYGERKLIKVDDEGSLVIYDDIISGRWKVFPEDVVVSKWSVLLWVQQGVNRSHSLWLQQVGRRKKEHFFSNGDEDIDVDQHYFSQRYECSSSIGEYICWNILCLFPWRAEE